MNKKLKTETIAPNLKTKIFIMVLCLFFCMTIQFAFININHSLYSERKYKYRKTYVTDSKKCRLLIKRPMVTY